jgi:hypothetical protein
VDASNPLSNSAWQFAAVVPALLAGTSCQVDGDDTFRITRVDFDGDATITLTFSDGIIDVGQVNPNDFRLSVARTYSINYTYEGVTYDYEGTTYLDVAYVLGDYYTQRFTFAELTRGGANQIVLTGVDSFGAACDEINEQLEQFEMYAQYYDPSAKFDAALFLHYASGDVPIESEAGSQLGDIGPDWVLNASSYFNREGFGFTGLAPQLRIPCQ